MLMQAMIILSDLGHGPFYVILALIMLTIGFRDSSFSKGEVSEWLWLGWRLSMFWVGGILISTCLKYHFWWPRPWWIDPSILPMHPSPAQGFGMPSGHTQSAVGLLLCTLSLPRSSQIGIETLLSFKDTFILRPLVFIGLLWVLMIAMSRVYLNAHSFVQVSAGCAVGLIWAVLIMYCERQRKGVVILSALMSLVSVYCLWQSQNPIPVAKIAPFLKTITDQGHSPPSPPHIFMLFSCIMISFACLLLCYKLQAVTRSMRISPK